MLREIIAEANVFGEVQCALIETVRNLQGVLEEKSQVLVVVYEHYDE